MGPLTPVATSALHDATLGRPGLTITPVASTLSAVIVRITPPPHTPGVITYILVCSIAGAQSGPQTDARPLILTTAGPHRLQPFAYHMPEGCRVTAQSGAARSPTVTAQLAGLDASSTTSLHTLAIIAVLLVGVAWIGYQRRRGRPDGATPPPLVHPPKHVI